ncbi:hypothetical protein [Phytohabitans flavus]|uniref:hypothetical protein n=1 Tax=Phytohabitans flavus TaxID=1076124 RepID=UPI0031EFD12B
MPSWLTIVAGWMFLVFGGLGLWRGATLLLRRGTAARDFTGMDGRLVLVEGGGQALLGAALLLGGGWVHLIWPAVLLMTIGAVHWVSSRLRPRRRRPSSPVSHTEHADT